jgi:hypothetical protein
VRRTKNFGAYLSALNQDVSRIESKPRISGISEGIISGSSLSASVVLENNFIQSGNYLPGLTGWKIDSNGVGEFSDIYVRGHIDAQTGSIGYWNISSPVVERTFGSRQLFGTFLESRDLGVSDNTQVKGSYVGLFRSYSEEGVAITHKYRVNNVATITSPDHGFENGDYVVVRLEDGDTSFSTGESNVRIFNVTKDNFSYVNQGDDFTFVVGGDIQDNSTYGTATLYIKDVSGLYLQDYGKKVFDYGYFSNEGVAYASAETFNLVYNPSLEYEIDGTNTSSITSWSRANTSAITISGVAFNSESSPINNLYRGGSDYGLNVSWTATPADASISVVSNYSLVDDLVSDDPTLYLHFDVFAAPYNNSPSVKVNSYTPSGNAISVTTATAHGLAVGDYIYESFIVPSGSADIVTVPGGESYVLKVTNVASNTVFSMNNSFGALPGFQDISDEATSVVSKVLVPEFKITEIKFDFGNNSNPVQFLSVATDAWIAEYNKNQYNGKLSLTESEVNSSILNDPANNRILVKNAPALGVGHRPTTGAHRLDFEIAISLSKLYKAYRGANPAGLAAMENFKIVFPAKVYPEGSSSAISAGSYTIDNVSLSTEKRFFYAESSPVSYSWYLPADKPNTVSVQDTKQWLDIDLINQTASYKYTDSFEFKSPSFSNDLTVNSGVYTVNNLENEEILWQGLHSDTTSSNLFVSSGAYTKPSEITTGAEITMQSYSLSIVSPSHTSYQISSDLNYANATTGNYIRTHAASIALDSYEDETIDRNGYKRDRGSQIWASADNIIFSTRNEIVGSDKNLKFSVYGDTEIVGNLEVKSGTVKVPIVNAGSDDGHAATVKFVKDNRQAYYLPNSNVSEATYANSKRIYISSSQPNAGTLGDIWVRI